MSERIQKYADTPVEERAALVDEVKREISSKKFKTYQKEITNVNKREAEEAAEDKAAVESESDDEVIETPDISKSGSSKSKGKGKEKENIGTKQEQLDEKTKEMVISEAVLEKFWKDLESMSDDQLLQESVIQAFQYVGFNPDAVMRSIIKRGRASKKEDRDILTDIGSMCTIAILKGSITDTNLKKMSDEGKAAYGVLEATYGLKKNGSRGVDPDVITVARVGAAFPGSIMKILMKKPELAKKFSGPFGSKALPSYLRHQSAAACIPDSLDETAKGFLLGLITAFTSDQSKTISKTKDKPEEIFERQDNFVTQTHSSHHPDESTRKALFKSMTLIADYDKLNGVATLATKIMKDFPMISKDDFVKAINGV